MTTSNSPDVIVVGSGVAGASAAVVGAEHGRVLVVTRGRLTDGCTEWAQGGIAAAVAADDSPERHLQDTLAAGRGLCDVDAVRILVEEAGAAIRRLSAWGVLFDRNPDGTWNLHQEAAHSRPRVLHARGDGTGREIEEALVRQVRDAGVDLLEHHVVTRVLLDDAGRCSGVAAVDTRSGRISHLGAGAVILATGGSGHLFGHTTNPEAARGEGVGLAYEAGAEVESCEFVQFHPTVLAISGSPAFLISEALRGAGAVVTDRAGRRFLLDTDPRGELAPRDIVARTIWQELARTGEKSVLLDCRPVGGDTAVRFPAIAARCIDHGIDITATPIPIAPAAHYMIGGIRTDIDGATSVPGLYACGEVASTGVHGANRLASNSLLEGAVFGPRTMEAALRGLAEVAPSALPVADVGSAPLEDPPAAEARSRIARVMGRDCGIVRHGKGLRAALGELDDIVATPIGSLSGRSAHLSAVAAYCIANAALYREESRGAHYRDDHPDTSHQWHGVTVMHTTRGATTHDRNVAADH